MRIQRRAFDYGRTGYKQMFTLVNSTHKHNKLAAEDADHVKSVLGDVVHIPSSKEATSNTDVIIDNAKGYIIVHPDRLISCTAVAESFFCLRKSILQQKFKAMSEYSEALVHGNLIHRIIQHALQAEDFTVEGIREEMRRVVLNSLEELFAIDQDEETAMSILENTIAAIKAFGDTYVGNRPKPNAKIASDMGPIVSNTLGCNTVAISRILDIEEHLWSPTFGLKGMIDASVEMKLSPNKKVLAVPLELKTGKASRFISHRAQTMLYTLLMGDRYGIVIAMLCL